MVKFPVNNGTYLQSEFTQLMADCEPATFGRGEKAVQMDRAQFCTSFNLHERGVMYAITQALQSNRSASDNGVRAELYKLNVGDFFYTVCSSMAI